MWIVNPVRNEPSSLKSGVWKICALALIVYSHSPPLHDRKKNLWSSEHCRAGCYLQLDSHMALCTVITSKNFICSKLNVNLNLLLDPLSKAFMAGLPERTEL